MQCVPAGDKEEHTSPTSIPAELEYAVYGKDTMRTLGHISGSTQMAIVRVKVASLCVEGDHHQGCLPIPHLLVRLL
jgi:hypothetical protein